VTTNNSIILLLFAVSILFGFGSTDSLDVWINFLDEEGKILNRRILSIIKIYLIYSLTINVSIS